MNESLCRLVESKFQSALDLGESLPVYRFGESGSRILPCVVIRVDATGINYALRRPDGQYGITATLTATAMVNAATPDSSAAVESIASQLIDAIETATIDSAGLLYLQIERAGDQRDFDGIRRSVAATWACEILAAV